MKKQKKPQLESLPNPWKQQNNQRLYENPWFCLDEDDVINPGGSLSHYGKILFKNIAIGIIPLDENNNTWLVGQYRYVPDCYSWEIPMGGGPLHIDPLESAKRELREETGFSADNWRILMHLHTSNSVTDERGIVFVATGLTPGETDFEETEDLRLLRLPLADAIQLAIDGEITDAVSVAGLLRLAISR